MSDLINFDRPTLSELLARTRGDLAGKVTNSYAYLRGSLEWALGGVVGGAASLLYGAIEQLYRNILADRSTAKWLERNAAVFGLFRLPAEPGSGDVEFTWTAGGSTIANGTVLTDAAGNEYEVDGAIADPGGPYPDTAIGSVDALYTGVASNLDAGTTLTITTPIAGISSTATVDSDFSGGSDVETDDDLRERLLDRMQNTSQGSAEADYRQWAQSVSGVDEVWVVQEVDTLPEILVIYTGSPLAATVQAAIDAKAPVCAEPVAASVDNDATYRYTVDMTITGLTVLPGYVLAEVKTAIGAAIESLFASEGGPGETVYNSQLRAAIQNTEGVNYYSLTALSDPSGPLATTDNLTAGTTTVHYLGTITWA